MTTSFSTTDCSSLSAISIATLSLSLFPRFPVSSFHCLLPTLCLVAMTGNLCIPLQRIYISNMTATRQQAIERFACCRSCRIPRFNAPYAGSQTMSFEPVYKTLMRGGADSLASLRSFTRCSFLSVVSLSRETVECS
jgi:hypothetical protein